jgi:hypothetical protein
MAKFEEVSRNQGVDTVKAGLEWMMVPLGGTNLVCLTDGAGFTLKEEKNKLKLIEEIPANRILGATGTFFRKGTLVFQFTGRAGGESHVIASNGKSKAQIAISVHPRRPFTISYFFLQDQDEQGNLKPRTAFKPGDAEDWTKAMNDIFGPQANMWFKTAKAETFPMPKLGKIVGVAADISRMEGHKDKGSEVNVFLAGPEIVSNEKDYPLGFYDTQAKLIVVKDQFVTQWGEAAEPMVATIAHEIAHLMYDRRKRPDPGHEYWQKVGYQADIENAFGGGDVKIPHQRVLDWNPW